MSFAVLQARQLLETVDGAATRHKAPLGASNLAGYFGTKFPGKLNLRTGLGWSQGPLNGGGFKRGGFPIWTCPSFFVLFGTFPIFLGFS